MAKAKPRGKPFTSDDPRINRKGPPHRTAGYRTWSAELWAHMMEQPTGPDNEPFLITATKKYMDDVLSGRGSKSRADFVERMFSSNMIEQLDSILTKQKTADVDYLRYLVFDHLFDEQQQVLLSKKRQKVLICGRRAGKTEALAAELIITALAHEKGDVLYIGLTAKRAYDIMWPRLTEILDRINVPYTPKISTQTIEFPSGVRIFINGAASRDDIEKFRGGSYRMVVIDEIQSQKDTTVKYLIEEALIPATQDYADSVFIMAGTPPRVAGTYIERVWMEPNDLIAKYKWNMSVNPFIENHEKALARVRDERHLKETDPIYRREYLGEMGVYDLDALVYRLEKPRNYYTDKDLWDWIQSQSRTDIWITGGLDFGWTDSDAFTLILYSASKKEKFVVYEYKKNRESLAELAKAIQDGIDSVKRQPWATQLLNWDGMRIFGDSADPRSLSDLRASYRLPVVPVKSKSNKEMSIERLQDEVRAGYFKVKEGSVFEDEAKQIIFKRNDDDQLTRELDDDFFHPDMADAVLYSLRHYWDTNVGISAK